MGKPRIPPGTFSAREIEVLQLRADGKTSQEIGAELCISVNTVKAHFKSMMSRLRAVSGFQLVALGFRQQVLK